MNPQPSAQSTDATARREVLTFDIDTHLYALDLKWITEIIGIQPITWVPHARPCVLGLVNLRGRVVPVMGLRERFGLPARPHDDRTCIVVVQVGTFEVGLVVDRVCEVAALPVSIISDAPFEAGKPTLIQAVAQVNDGVVLILDAEQVVSQ